MVVTAFLLTMVFPALPIDREVAKRGVNTVDRWDLDLGRRSRWTRHQMDGRQTTALGLVHSDADLRVGGSNNDSVAAAQLGPARSGCSHAEVAAHAAVAEPGRLDARELVGGIGPR